jgi:hypothetical protein
MPLKDPPRLLDPGAGTRGFVREALDAGRADRPGKEQLARLAQRLPIAAAPPPDGPGPAPRGGGSLPAPLAPIPSALPGAIVGAVLGLAVIGLHTLLAPSAPSPADDRRAPAALVVDAPSPIAAPARPRVDDAAAIAPTAAARPIAAPTTTAVSSAEPTAPAADPSSLARPAASAIPRSSLDPAGGSASGDLGAQAPALAGETEIQLLQRAQDALGGAPARALDLLNQHAARFPGTGLGQEREVLAIDALVRLGRTDEARARTAAFASRFPRSAHLRRLEALVPGNKIDSEVHKAPSEATPTGN